MRGFNATLQGMVKRRKKKQAKPEIKAYRCKTAPLSGHRFVDIMPQARRVFRTLQKQTKRRPYVRSEYFHKDKIFFDFFWQHMQQKLPSDRARRLIYFPCALEVLRNSRHDPETYIDIRSPGIIKHRFVGITPGGQRFGVVIHEDRKTNKKQLLTIYALH